MSECRSCHGTGVIGPRALAEEPCADCGGSGKVPHPTPPSSEALGNQQNRLDLAELEDYAKDALQGSALQHWRFKNHLSPDIALLMIAEMKVDQATIIDQAVKIDALEARLAAVPAHPKAESASLLEEAEKVIANLRTFGDSADLEDADDWLTRYTMWLSRGTQETKAAEKEGE